MIRSPVGLILLISLALAGLGASAAAAQDDTLRGLRPADMFRIATEMAAAGRTRDASAIYDALAHDSDVTIRSEARFRYAKLLVGEHRFADPALLYRAILDEQPDAQPVRLELAAVLARLGHFTAAWRQLRQAQAGTLPAEVGQIVNQYAAALRSFRPIAASVEIALAPSNNVNRATRSTTLDTVIAPFQLSDDARAKSSIGARIGGTISMRLPLSPLFALTGRTSGQGDLYRDSAFNDVVASVEGGSEWLAGRLRIQPLLGRSWRWYGNHPYATTNSGSVKLTQPLGGKSQIELNVGAGYSDYKLNDLQDGTTFNASLGYERAFSQRAGGGITLGYDRQAANDPGYATRAGSIQFLAWREMGKVSTFAAFSIARIRADARLFLFPARREDWMYRTTVGASFRQIIIGGFSPILRFTYERSQSTVGLYDYSRIGGNVGLTHAF